MDLKRLQYFVTLVEHGSFVRAAEALHMTQSALSHSIRTLEEQVGLTLLDRGKAGVEPTQAGTQLLTDATALLRQATTLRTNLRALARLETGRVSFGVAPLPAYLWLSAALAALLANHPGVIAHASVTAISELFDQLRQDRIEFFISARDPLPMADWYEIHPLTRLELALITRADHPLQHHPAPAMADLARFPLASVATDFARAEPAAPPPPTPDLIAVECADCHVLCDLTLHSDIVWITSALVARRDPERLAVLRITVDSIPPATDIVIVSHAGRTLSPAAKLVIGTIRAQAGRDVSGQAQS